MTADFSKATADALAFTRKLTQRWSHRLTGSDECLACARELEATLHAITDKVETQNFTTHPKSFLGFIKINVACYGIALALLYFGWIGAATVIMMASVLITVLQFFLYRELTDPLYAKRPARNVWGTLEPTHEVRRQVYVTAHHDSAFVFNYIQHFPKYYNVLVNAGLGVYFAFAFTLLGTSVCQLVYQAVSANTLQLMFWIFMAASVIVWPLWFFAKDTGTPGAGDNLICTAVSLEIGKHFKELRERGQGLRHTRIVIGSWDAEECGLRGARAYVAAHKDQLHAVKTYNYNLECLYDHRTMHMLTSDLNSFVPLSTPMAQRCAAIGQRLGYEVSTEAFPLLAGGTDAAEFAKGGIEATTFIAMSFTEKGELPAYHTLRDTVEAVDPAAVQAAIHVGIEFIQEVDKES